MLVTPKRLFHVQKLQCPNITKFNFKIPNIGNIVSISNTHCKISVNPEINLPLQSWRREHWPSKRRQQPRPAKAGEEAHRKNHGCMLHATRCGWPWSGRDTGCQPFVRVGRFGGRTQGRTLPLILNCFCQSLLTKGRGETWQIGTGHDRHISPLPLKPWDPGCPIKAVN